VATDPSGNPENDHEFRISFDSSSTYNPSPPNSRLSSSLPAEFCNFRTGADRLNRSAQAIPSQHHLLQPWRDRSLPGLALLSPERRRFFSRLRLLFLPTFSFALRLLCNSRPFAFPTAPFLLPSLCAPRFCSSVCRWTREADIIKLRGVHRHTSGIVNLDFIDLCPARHSNEHSPRLLGRPEPRQQPRGSPHAPSSLRKRNPHLVVGLPPPSTCSPTSSTFTTLPKTLEAQEINNRF
jgi:hypothetical protein